MTTLFQCRRLNIRTMSVRAALAMMLLLFSVASVSADEGNALILVREGHPEAEIVLGHKGDKVKAAAEAVQHYIEKMSGATVPIRMTTGEDDRSQVAASIYIGTAAEEHPFDINATEADLGEEGFVIRSVDKGVVILGGSELGAQHGTYAFMEQALGIRWYWPTPLGEVVPSQSTIAVKPLDITSRPALAVRHWRTKFASDFGWHLNEADYRHFLAAARIKHVEIGLGHIYDWLLWMGYTAKAGRENIAVNRVLEALLKEHPEWFAMRDGKRPDSMETWSRHQLCTSNEELIQYVSDGILAYFERHPEASTMSLSPNDGNLFCECDECQSLDKDLGSITDRIMLFNRSVIEQTVERFPDKVFGWYAYLNVRPPPKTVKVPPQIVVGLTPEPWTVSHVAPLFDSAIPAHKQFEADLEGWREVTDRIIIREYYGHGAVFGPFPIEAAQAVNFRHYAQMPEVMGFTSEWFNNWPMQGLNFYILSRLAWDPTLDWRQIVEEYCQTFFGPAGDTMLEYYDTLRVACETATRDSGKGGYSWVEGFSPEVNERGEQLLRRALNEAETERQRQRIGLILDTYRIHKLWRQMTPVRYDLDKWTPLAERFMDYVQTHLREPTFEKFRTAYGVHRYSVYVRNWMKKPSKPGQGGWRP